MAPAIQQMHAQVLSYSWHSGWKSTAQLIRHPHPCHQSRNSVKLRRCSLCCRRTAAPCTFLNFIQPCFTSICNCDWAGNEDLPLPRWQISRDSAERACVHVWETQTGSRGVDNTILWHLTAASGATLWLRRRVVGRFRSSVINNGNRSF